MHARPFSVLLRWLGFIGHSPKAPRHSAQCQPSLVAGWLSAHATSATPPPALHLPLFAVTFADHGHAHTDETIDKDTIWNSVVDAVEGGSTEEVEDEEEAFETAAEKAKKDILAALSVSP